MPFVAPRRRPARRRILTSPIARSIQHLRAYLPALAMLLALPVVAGRRVVFSGDLKGDTPGLVEFIQDADLLVMDHAIPGSSGRVARNLHAAPERIGTLARQAHVKTLLLSHLMARSLADPEHNPAQIRAHFDGRILIAEDLMCLALEETAVLR